MPRHRRLDIPGAVYHVITRGIERREIYREDSDRDEFLRRFGEALKETNSQCYAWVLMPNHFHLLIRVGKKSLSDLMRKVLTGYAIYFNRKYKRNGYVYQNRYKSILCQEDAYFLELVRYIHLNPLRVGLTKDIQGLNTYKWSGHSVLMRNNKIKWQSCDEILEKFGKHRRKAINNYLKFIEDGQNMGKRDDLCGGGLRRSAGGWTGVLNLKKAKEFWRGDERILGDGDFVNEVLRISEEKMNSIEKFKREGWDIEKLIERVCQIMSIKKDDILKRSRLNNISQARELLTYWGNNKLGITGKQLSDYLGISKAAVTKSIRRGEKLATTSNLKLIS